MITETEMTKYIDSTSRFEVDAADVVWMNINEVVTAVNTTWDDERPGSTYSGAIDEQTVKDARIEVVDCQRNENFSPFSLFEGTYWECEAADPVGILT